MAWRHSGPGERVGVPWLGWTCGVCEYCTTGRENLCPHARFTGYQIDGGFAAAQPMPMRAMSCPSIAFCRCGGGATAVRRADRLARVEGGRTWASGLDSMVLAQPPILRFRSRAFTDQEVFAFVRPGDEKAREFALRMGAVWAGPSDAPAPAPLDAAIIFAPAGELVPVALAAVKPGGVVVCGGIHMSDIPSFPYGILWQERVLRSIANLTRADAVEFLALAEQIPVRTETVPYLLEDANQALANLREGGLSGAAVLIP